MPWGKQGDDFQARLERDAQNAREREAAARRKLMNKITEQREPRTKKYQAAASDQRLFDRLSPPKKTTTDFEKRAKELVDSQRHKQADIVKAVEAREKRGRRDARNARRRAEYRLKKEMKGEVKEASKHLSYSEIMKLRSQLSEAHRRSVKKLKQQEQQTGKQLRANRIAAEKAAKKANDKAKAEAAKQLKQAKKNKK